MHRVAFISEYIDAHADLVERDLVVLSKARLDSDVPHTWVSWQDLTIAIGAGGFRSS